MNEPPHTRWLFRGFRRHCFRYARKRFHGVRLSKSGHTLPQADGSPLLFVVNHPSWWDIITLMMLTGEYPHYRHFAPIDAAMLPKYLLFRQMGFFGVDDTVAGTKAFLQATKAMFAKPETALWITAQGDFVDVRVRPVVLRPGIGHVASTLKDGWVVPIAIEYLFWNESKPEALLRVGEPLPLDVDRPKDEWTNRIARALEDSMDVLAKEAISRDANLFDALTRSRTDVGGLYDIGRRLAFWSRGKKADLSHMDGEAGK